MRVNTKIVIDLKTGQVIDRISHKYDGPICEVGGSRGGGTSTTTSIQGSPTASALANLGAGFLAPAFGQQLTGFSEGPGGSQIPIFQPIQPGGVPAVSTIPTSGQASGTPGTITVPVTVQQLIGFDEEGDPQFENVTQQVQVPLPQAPVAPGAPSAPGAPDAIAPPSFQPLSGIRQRTFGELESQIPLLQQQVARATALPGDIRNITLPGVGGTLDARQLIGSAGIQGDPLATNLITRGAGLFDPQARGLALSGASQFSPTATSLVAQGATAADPAARFLGLQGASRFDPRSGALVAGGGARFDPRAGGLVAAGGTFRDPRAEAFIQSSAGRTGASDLAVLEALEAFSPIRGTREFQIGSERLLQQLRPGLAARGIVGGGVAQGIEGQSLRELAKDISLREAENRARAIQQLEATGGANLARRLQAGTSLAQIAAEAGTRGITAGGTLGQLAAERGGREITAGTTLGQLAAERGQRELGAGGLLSQILAETGGRAITGGDVLGRSTAELGQRQLAGSGLLSQAAAEQGGRAITGGTALGQLGLQSAAQRLAAGRGLLGATQIENQLTTDALTRGLQRAGAELQSIVAGQGAIARGFQLPLDVLNQAVATELAPLTALTGLASAASGGTQVGQSVTRQPSVGGGIFGK